jgi:hypothetical protein
MSSGYHKMGENGKGFKLLFIVNIDDSHLNSDFRWETPSQELPKISLDPNLDFGGIIKLTLEVGHQPNKH